MSPVIFAFALLNLVVFVRQMLTLYDVPNSIYAFFAFIIFVLSLGIIGTVVGVTAAPAILKAMTFIDILWYCGGVSVFTLVQLFFFDVRSGAKRALQRVNIDGESGYRYGHFNFRWMSGSVSFDDGIKSQPKIKTEVEIGLLFLHTLMYWLAPFGTITATICEQLLKLKFFTRMKQWLVVRISNAITKRLSKLLST